MRIVKHVARPVRLSRPRDRDCRYHRRCCSKSVAADRRCRPIDAGSGIGDAGGCPRRAPSQFTRLAVKCHDLTLARLLSRIQLLRLLRIDQDHHIFVEDRRRTKSVLADPRPQFSRPDFFSRDGPTLAASAARESPRPHRARSSSRPGYSKQRYCERCSGWVVDGYSRCHTNVAAVQHRDRGRIASHSPHRHSTERPYHPTRRATNARRRQRRLHRKSAGVHCTGIDVASTHTGAVGAAKTRPLLSMRKCRVARQQKWQQQPRESRQGNAFRHHQVFLIGRRITAWYAT